MSLAEKEKETKDTLKRVKKRQGFRDAKPVRMIAIRRRFRMTLSRILKRQIADNRWFNRVNDEMFDRSSSEQNRVCLLGPWKPGAGNLG